ncbi:hypothetical protein, conserved [Babesia bigemina]|uniref:Spindle assembly abnormal protein 6 N-terminal domain-containing protein n=1 Tax=Babesia bigemina TaxID=5866 RepID=A0A061D8X3_BABBI|nr:hypothetical protein, conserved [Babesia bigemina]CDR94190.1 hypothetical protein, conserved [Babesia bigemina]|eukprot:XP_012766376.1 hypothetical protein, conserved [Babesia bigemina]
MCTLFLGECKAEVRGTVSDLGGTKGHFNFKVTRGNDVVELEITSESDLFFNYIHRVTRDDYDVICKRQRLTAEFADYADTLSRMILSCIESESFLAFIFLNGGEGTLQFVQNADYKFIELLECNLQRANEFRIVENITYRYNTLKERLNHFGKHLEDVSTYLKTKDPECTRQRLFG